MLPRRAYYFPYQSCAFENFNRPIVRLGICAMHGKVLERVSKSSYNEENIHKILRSMRWKSREKYASKKIIPQCNIYMILQFAYV